MIYVLILSICIAGSCKEFRPEDDYVLFRDLDTCRQVKEAIIASVLSAKTRQEVSAHGLCVLVGPKVAEDQ